MLRRSLCAFANLLLAAYAIDAAISFLCLLTDHEVLASIRNAMAMLVLLSSFVAIPLLGLTRKLPLSVFLPIVASALIFNIGLIPLVYSNDWDVVEASAVAAQCLIAMAVYFRVRSLRGGEGWVFVEDSFSGKLFSLPYFLGYEFVAFFVLVSSSLLFAVSSLAIGVDVATKGFVRFDVEGISLADRLYENSGRRIRLVGMMHIGEDEGYRTLFHDLGRGSSSMLVLTEGVSDVDGLLSGQLSYSSIADVLGVGEQQSIESYVDWEGRAADDDELGLERPVFMNADIDLNEFAPRTVELLDEIASLYRSENFLPGFLEVYEQLRVDPEASADLTRDIIDRRNRSVIAHITDFKKDYREIVVPWGALHLPGIASAIEEMGFVLRSTRYVRFISWRRVMDALGSESPAEQSALEPSKANPSPISLVFRYPCFST